jgi:TonB family protein
MDRPEEDSAVAILSPSYARAQGDFDMIGRTIVLDGRDFTVIGVLTEDADRFPVDVWIRESPNRSAVAAEPVTPDSETPYFEFQVEKPVTQDLQSPQPLYPDVLRDAGIEGEVLAQFVVDTVGLAEPGSLKILQASHDLFAQAVTEMLPRMRFVPAETGGRKVKQFVQQPFVFSLRR